MKVFFVFAEININFVIQSSLWWNMKQEENPIQDLTEIRQMMEKSSKFLSLSGLSGVTAGVTALAGYIYIQWQISSGAETSKLEMALIGSLVLLIAASLSAYFSFSLSKKKGIPVWGLASKNLLRQFLPSLITGGLFCVGLYYVDLFHVSASATLCFYGLGLISCGNNTFPETRQLGYIEIFLGLLALVFLDFSLIFWAVGFGVFHIVFGIILYLKYDQ